MRLYVQYVAVVEQCTDKSVSVAIHIYIYISSNNNGFEY